MENLNYDKCTSSVKMDLVTFTIITITSTILLQVLSFELRKREMATFIQISIFFMLPI